MPDRRRARDTGTATQQTQHARSGRRLPLVSRHSLPLLLSSRAQPALSRHPAAHLVTRSANAVRILYVFVERFCPARGDHAKGSPPSMAQAIQGVHPAFLA